MNLFFNLLMLFCFNTKLKLSRAMQYRTDFFIGIFISLGLSCLGPIFQYLIISQSNGYPGWNLHQVILYQGVLLLWFGIKDILFGEIRSNIEKIGKSGELDMLLLKPYPSIGIILTNGFYFQGISSIITGLIIIIFSINVMSLQINIFQILLFFIFILSGIILYMAITVIYCAIAVRLIHMNRLSEILDKFLMFSQYPVEIFMPVLRITFLVFFPVALWIYFPAQSLLNRVNMIAIPGTAISIILFLISILIWNNFIKKYTSAGG